LLRGDGNALTVVSTTGAVVNERFIGCLDDTTVHQVAANDQTSSTLTSLAVDSNDVVLVLAQPIVLLMPEHRGKSQNRIDTINIVIHEQLSERVSEYERYHCSSQR
jgi:hypothetical protein